MRPPWRPLALALLLSLDVAAASPRTMPRPEADVQRRQQQGAASGPVQAWYYPGYSSALAPVATLPWEYINFMIYFVYPTTLTGIDPSTAASDAQLPLLRNATAERGIPLLMSVGGWDGSQYFSQHVGSADNITRFVQEIVGTVAEGGFDGVDVDWEFPNDPGVGCNAYAPSDAANLLSFFQALRTALDNSTAPATSNSTAHGDGSGGKGKRQAPPAGRKYITAAVGVQGWNGPDNQTVGDLGAYAQVVDYLTIMNYDVYNSLSNSTGPASPLSSFCQPSSNDYSAEQSVALWTSSGFPAKQLILGIPTYAHGWTTPSAQLANDTVSGAGFTMSSLYYQPVKSVPEGDETDSEGEDVCGVNEGWQGAWLDKSLVTYQFLGADGVTPGAGWQRYWDNCSSTPFIFNSQNLTFISYDDAESTAIKAGWAARSGLAGIGYFDATGPLDATLAAAQAALLDPANAPPPIPDLPGNATAGGQPSQTMKSGAGRGWRLQLGVAALAALAPVL